MPRTASADPPSVALGGEGVGGLADQYYDKVGPHESEQSPVPLSGCFEDRIRAELDGVEKESESRDNYPRVDQQGRFAEEDPEHAAVQCADEPVDAIDGELLFARRPSIGPQPST